jgi:hypothetical protein
LHEVLRGRAILPAPTKETRFFDLHFNRGIHWYRAHYPNSIEDLPIGEIAPTYFASDEARRRIAWWNPKAKVICTLRDPVERVLSLYRLKKAYGAFPWALEEAIVRDAELIESGRYATHLAGWQRVLGSDQVLVTFYEDLQNDPQAYIDQVADFIGVPRFALTPSQIKRVHTSATMTHPRNYSWTRTASNVADWLKARRLGHVVATVKQSHAIKLFLGGGRAFEELTEHMSGRLYEIFRPEVENLEVLLHRDFSHWKAREAFLALPPRRV